MDRRVTFNEVLNTLLNHYGRLPEPRYAGDEYRLPISVDVSDRIEQYKSGNGLTESVGPDRRVVLIADYGVRWSGGSVPPLVWFFKGIE